MTSEEIKEIIDKVELSDKDLILINIEDSGYIELTKKQVLSILKEEYSFESLKEFREWISTKDVKYNHLASKLNIHPVKFTQMMSGHLKSTKKVGSRLEFISKVKAIF